MAEINKIRRCYSCGAILQSDDPTKEGFVKKETLDNATQNFLFCDKCFEEERFKDSLNEPPLEEDYLTLIKDAKKKQALIVYVVNLYSFEAAFNHAVNELLEGMNILVVGTKFDLLPVKTDKDMTKEYVAHRFRASGLTIHSENVMLISILDDDAARDVLTRIFEMKNGKDVYIIGSHLSGKSTLISSFLRVVSNLSRGNIVTEPYPNTSLSVLKIPLTARATMYDTPGLSLDNSILSRLDKQQLKEIWLTKPVTSREIALSPGHSLLIGGLAIIEMVDGKKTSFDCYLRDKVSLKKVRVSEKKPIDQHFIKLIEKESVNPALHSIKTIKDLDVYKVNVTESNRRDIGILGLGWLSFEANKQLIRVYLPNGVSMYHSRSKVLIRKK